MSEPTTHTDLPAEGNPASVSPCCPEGSIGKCDAGSSGKGTWTQIGKSSLPIYITKPEDDEVASKQAIIVFHDIFGPFSGYTIEICDRLAKECNCLVVMPDLFHGTPPLDPASDTDSFFGIARLTFKFPFALYKLRSSYKWNGPLGSDILEVLLPFLARQYDIHRLALVGYCFGSWVVMRTCYALNFKKDDTLAELSAVAGVSAHPSFMLFSLYGEETKQEVLANVGCPQMLLSAANDSDDSKPNGEAEKLWMQQPWFGNCHIQSFDDMKHGWVNRGDRGNSAVATRAEEAVHLMSQFCKKHLI